MDKPLLYGELYVHFVVSDHVSGERFLTLLANAAYIIRYTSNFIQQPYETLIIFYSPPWNTSLKQASCGVSLWMIWRKMIVLYRAKFCLYLTGRDYLPSDCIWQDVTTSPLTVSDRTWLPPLWLYLTGRGYLPSDCIWQDLTTSPLTVSDRTWLPPLWQDVITPHPLWLYLTGRDYLPSDCIWQDLTTSPLTVSDRTWLPLLWLYLTGRDYLPMPQMIGLGTHALIHGGQFCSHLAHQYDITELRFRNTA